MDLRSVITTLIIICISSSAVTEKNSDYYQSDDDAQPTPDFFEHIKGLDLSAHSVDVLRIKIFPHERDYKPHGIDKIRNRAVLLSNTSCEIYKASPTSAIKLPHLVDVARTIELDANNMRDEALWVDCPEEAILKRPNSETSYSYQGHFYIKSEKSSDKGSYELLVINIVDLETYLRGVVPSEVFPMWPEESLKAQTVAARSYAVFHKIFADSNPNHNPYYDIDDTISYQAYTGLSQAHPRTDAAIVATKSQIITHQGKVVQAYYHADSAGITEDPSSGFGMPIPYCASKKEPLDKSEYVNSGWEKIITLSDLKNLNKSALKTINGTSKIIPNFDFLSIENRSPTGRVNSIKLSSINNNNEILISGKSFVQSLGLKSNFFEIIPIYGPYKKSQDRAFMIRGKGFGHGVGMSQLGSQKLAEIKGWNYTQILSFYFDHIVICPISKCGKIGESVAKNVRKR